MILNLLMVLIATLALQTAFASDCSLRPEGFWAHYADEWGHEEKKPEKLKERDITMGVSKGKWIYLPRTCTKHGCDVSFYLKLPTPNCWKPMVSVQGRIQALKKNDWTRFKNTYLRSMVDEKKKSEQIWLFDAKEKTFRQEPKPTAH
jgi:hypothetical protein